MLVEEPVSLKANWRSDETQPRILISVLVGVTTLIVIFPLYWRRRLIASDKAKSKPEEPEKTIAETWSLKEEFREVRKTLSGRKRRTPPPPPEEQSRSESLQRLSLWLKSTKP